eukprot:3948260-Pyramimonas_sp.AAC.1
MHTLGLSSRWPVRKGVRKSPRGVDCSPRWMCSGSTIESCSPTPHAALVCSTLAPRRSSITAMCCTIAFMWMNASDWKLKPEHTAWHHFDTPATVITCDTSVSARSQGGAISPMRRPALFCP